MSEFDPAAIHDLAMAILNATLAGDEEALEALVGQPNAPMALGLLWGLSSGIVRQAGILGDDEAMVDYFEVVLSSTLSIVELRMEES